MKTFASSRCRAWRRPMCRFRGFFSKTKPCETSATTRRYSMHCCNFLDGECLLLDSVCPQYISRSLLCRWFRRAVLPRQPKLEQAILSPKKLRRCEVCGTGILARSGRAKYCPACAKKVHRQQKAKSARKRRSGVDNLRAKSP